MLLAKSLQLRGLMFQLPISCIRSRSFSDAEDRNRGSWAKSSWQTSRKVNKFGRNRAGTIDSEVPYNEDEGLNSHTKPRFTRPTKLYTNSSERDRYREDFAPSSDFSGRMKTGSLPYKDCYNEDEGMNSYAKPRITRPTKPYVNTSNRDRYEKDFQPSSDFSGNTKTGFYPRHSRENSFNPRREGPEDYTRADWKHRVNNRQENTTKIFTPSKKNFPSDEERKNYNYGLSGVGKVRPGQIKNVPNVTGEIVYGIHAAVLALASGRREIHKCYIRDTLEQEKRPIVQQLMSLLQDQAVDVEICDKQFLNSLSQARPHQGVCLDAGRLEYEPLTSSGSTVEDLSTASDDPRLFVVLDSVQDPMNLGAIIRSAYFLGVDQLFVVKENSCSLTPVVSKSSAGVMEINKIYAIPDLLKFLEEHKEGGWHLLGTTGSSEANPEQVVSLQDVSVKQNTILILGNEGSGLSEEVEGCCHRLVKIPPGRTLHPLIDSLNVSVASGIVLHHLCKFKHVK